MKNLKIIIAVLGLFMLTGCWDRVELEDRGFVISIGIDTFEKTTEKEKETNQTEAQKTKAMQPMAGKNENNQENEKEKKDEKEKKTENKTDENKESKDKKEKKEKPATIGEESKQRYLLTMVMPNMTALAEKGGGDAKSRFVKKAGSETVSGAMHTTDTFSSKKLYFGQSKLVVLGKEIIDDEKLFREAVDALERNRQISRKVIVLATKDKASKIVEAQTNAEPMVGMFVSNFYKNNHSTVAVSFKQDLESLIRSLRSTKTSIIPEILLEGEELILKGAAVIKDYKLTGWLTDIETRGYLWAKNLGEGAEISVNYKGDYIPLKVEKLSGGICFEKKPEGITCKVEVKATGVIEEFKMSNQSLQNEDRLKDLQNLYKDLIKTEITNTWKLFKNLNVDGFELKEELRKKNYSLYKEVENNWEQILENMQLETDIKVEIAGTGSII